MWVENLANGGKKNSNASSSLWGCELKNYDWNKDLISDRHPPCEDVSWKDEFTVGKVEKVGHPPCEDVSWKIDGYWYELDEDVILLVRMWVEKLYCRSNGYNKGSSSLWGCELKTACSSRQWIPLRHPPCEDVSWKIAGELSDSLGKVILLVRMWVEKTKNIRQQYIAIVILLVRMWVENFLLLAFRL